MEIRNTLIGDISLRESTESLCLGTDSLLLSAYIRKNSGAMAIELGAGSGVVSLLVAKRKTLGHIKAVEIQKEHSRLCALNITENGLGGAIEALCADARSLRPEDFPGISVIFANPPYMETGRGKESVSLSRNASRHEVFGGMREFAACAGRILKTGGRFYTVYRPDRLVTLFRSLSENRFSPKRMTFISLDPGHAPSSVLTEAVKDGSESLYITPTLYLKSADGCYSADAAYIYENGVFPPVFFNK